MTAEIPGRPLDEPAGDAGDQASWLQMVEEQAAIQAARDGRGHVSDDLDDGPQEQPAAAPST